MSTPNRDVPGRALLTASDFEEAIERVARGKARVLIIHSSMPAIAGTRFEVRRWQVVQAMRRLVARGYTLVFPSFTFSYGAGRGFDQSGSPSETGLLADWMRVLPEARRTPSPIFSFVVMGDQADQFLLADHSDAYGERSPLAVLERLQARIVMLGAKWDYCSFLHRMEQEFQVPYREFRVFHHPADFGCGPVDPEYRVFVRRSDVDTELNFSCVGQYAQDAGFLRRSTLGCTQVEAIEVTDLARLCRAHMRTDPCFLLKDSLRVARDIGRIRYRNEQPEFRVAVLSGANTSVLLQDLEQRAQDTLPHRRIRFFAPAFGQSEREMRDPASELYRFAPHLSVVCDTAESICGTLFPSSLNPALRSARLGRWLESLHHWVAQGVGRTAVLEPVVSRCPAEGTWTTVQDGGVFAQVAEMRVQLEALLRRTGGVMIGATAVIAMLREPMNDTREWYLTRSPWSRAFSAQLASRITGLVAAETGHAIRLIVLDLDNTLWGGVAGEDGVSGLTLGGDGLGAAFRDFQSVLKSLERRGIALAVVSKNDEATALDIIDRHPAMVLRRSDFATWEINWEPKAENIARIAGRLRLNLSNVLFVDDNPVERRAVAELLPEVNVLELGTDPIGYVDALVAEPLLEATVVTQEDDGRTRALQRVSGMHVETARTGDFSRFVAGLRVEVELSPVTPATINRAVQLMAKTNQFNSTVRRYGREDLDAIIDDGGDVLLVEVEDVVSPREIMGLIVIRAMAPSTVDSILLSCRTLGKGVEVALTRHIARAIEQSGRGNPAFAYVPSQRNALVRDTLVRAGFAENTDGWRPGRDFDSVVDLPVGVKVEVLAGSKHAVF